MFQLLIVGILFLSVFFALISSMIGSLILLVGALGTVIPQIALTIRRMHDQDKSGWFSLFYLLPYVGGFIVLIFMLIPGTDGSNRFGDAQI